ncbi:hypothetical protein Hanom_Chr05g00471821 [Helianthus anomalus]
MKRSISLSQDHLNGSCNIHIDNDSGKMKKKIREDPIPETDPAPENSPDTPETTTAVLLDENLLYEVLKHQTRGHAYVRCDMIA